MSHDSVAHLRHYLVHTTTTFDADGADSKEIFLVQGIVDILYIYGIVTTILNADVDNLSLDVFPDGGALVALAALVDSATAPVGSLFVKEREAGQTLVLNTSVTCFVFENTTFNKPLYRTIVGEMGDGTPTNIRVTYTGVATDGAIDWHVDYRPLSDDGLLTAV